MSEWILECAKQFKSLVVDEIVGYYKFIESYDANMTTLLTKLQILCSKKLDTDAKVTEGKLRSREMTMETVNWLRSLQELIERAEMNSLMEDDRVAEIVSTMMEQRAMKRLLKEDRETFDIVVRVVKKKCSQDVGNGELVDAEEHSDYKKIAEIAREVMEDTAQEFRKFIKEGDGAVVAVKLLSDVDLEKLRKIDEDMVKTLSQAEEIIRKELQHNDPDDKNFEPADENNIKKRFGIWRRHIGSLMAFLDDENFKKSLPNGENIVLEVMLALSESVGHEHTEENAKQHGCCGCCVLHFNGYRHRHDMSELAEVMTKEIKAMIEGCPSGIVTRPKRVDQLETISCEFTKGLKSREKLLQDILTALKDDRVNSVGIYGMGGAGKTTLARQLANKSGVDFFNKRVVVEVSEAPNIKVIQNQIAEGIGSLLNDKDSVNLRAIKLNDALKSEKQKKILIILDNVWKKLNLDAVGIPRERTKDFCCKILVTTREKQVCGAMDIENANIYKAGLLNNTEALSLFENKIREQVGGEEYKPW